MTRKKILVPTDFSPVSLTALKYVAEMFDPAATEVILLSVVDPIVYTPAGYGYAGPDPGVILQEQQRAARANLVRLERKWRVRLPRLRTMLVTGMPSASIVAVAKKAKVDLIVLTTHGLTGLKHFFIGSVAERVVRMATCPVLTVRTAPRSNRKIRRRLPRAKAAA